MQQADIKPWLADVLHKAAYSQHMISGSLVRLQGDRATGRTYCLNLMGARDENGAIRHMVYSLWYVDEFVRTDLGWRISRRHEEFSHTVNVPNWPD